MFTNIITQPNTIRWTYQAGWTIALAAAVATTLSTNDVPWGVLALGWTGLCARSLLETTLQISAYSSPGATTERTNQWQGVLPLVRHGHDDRPGRSQRTQVPAPGIIGHRNPGLLNPRPHERHPRRPETCRTPDHGGAPPPTAQSGPAGHRPRPAGRRARIQPQLHDYRDDRPESMTPGHRQPPATLPSAQGQRDQKPQPTHR